MSGIGKRFIDAGYTEPKPLIKIDGMHIIEHVCNLFPGENKFTFICNSKHLLETDMRDVLFKIKPSAHIVEIPNHKKGPVFAVSQAIGLIEDDEEVIVNYCDFGTYWSFTDFLKHTRQRGADGAIPSYKGFHPHMLGSTNYAFIRHEDQWMLEIKEKEPFTDNRMQEYASNGTYYFRKGKFVKKYFNELINKNIDLKGEYYVSLVFNLMFEDKLKISIYEIQHMLQWGTPNDVGEYNNWSNYFRNIIKQGGKALAKENTITLIPLAGKGSRFSNLNYPHPKPLMEVSGSPMIIQAARSLPRSKKHIFVTLQDHLDKFYLENILTNEFAECLIVPINEVTEGQAITCSLGLEKVNEEASLLIAATDNSMIYDQEKYRKLTEDSSVDAVIFTFRHHVSSKTNPQMYGWVKVNDKDEAIGVSVKLQISDDPFNDHAIVGSFYFKKSMYFNQALSCLLEKNIKVNGEYYVDSLMQELISLGLKVKILEVEDYICWGTPNDYETFNYWQSFFHKCDWHPYSIKGDYTVNKTKINQIETQYNSFKQEFVN